MRVVDVVDIDEGDSRATVAAAAAVAVMPTSGINIQVSTASSC